MSMPGIRSLVAALSMQGFFGAQRLDAAHLQRQADLSLLASAVGYQPTGRRRYRQPTNVNRPGHQRLAPARGPGSMDCENEIRVLIRQGKRAEAVELYEANGRVYFTAGDNPGIPRLARWYRDAKVGEARAA